ncbi:MAG: hypothetical protein WD757_06905 [Actinomycetota bacterium]
MDRTPGQPVGSSGNTGVPQEEKPPPFDPDWDLITFLEGGSKRAVARWLRRAEPRPT